MLKNSEKVHTAERLLQLVVDTMIDINEHFIKELELTLTEDFQSTFITIGDNNVLSKDLAQQIAPVVGLRNMIVYVHEKLDNQLFLETLRKERKDFEDYIKQVQEYLEKG